MSRRATKCLSVSVLLIACSLFAKAAPAPGPTCDFAKGFPKAGSKQGEVDVVIEWANCNGVDLVVGGISKTVNGQPKLIGNGFSVKGTQQNPLLATGSYSWNIATGEPTGTVITSGTADAFQGANRLASNGGVKLNVTIP